MKLITSLTALVAAASAGQIFSQPQAEYHAKAADIYQSAVEYQQPANQAGQLHAYAAHDLAYQRPSAEKTARILAYHAENNDHSYRYAYETENGIKAQESGHVAKGTTAEGAYSYTGDDGHTYTVTYTADEHGFHPQGSHIPTPPPIPAAILKSLEENAKDEANGIYDDGHYHDQHQQQQHHQQQYNQQQQYHHQQQQEQQQQYHLQQQQEQQQQYHQQQQQQFQAENYHGDALYYQDQAQNYNNHVASEAGYQH